MRMCDTNARSELSGRSPAKDTSKEVGGEVQKKERNHVRRVAVLS